MKQYGDMLWVLTKTDFKRRYQQSVLGFVWAMLKPAVLFVVLYVVFSQLLGVSGLEYALQLLITLLFWMFFSEATLIGLTSLVAKTPLLTKMAFPRILIPLAVVLSSYLGFALMIAALNLIAGLPFFGIMVMSVIMLMIVVGVSLILAPLYARFRHVHQLWDVVLLVGFYVHPILYSLADLPQEFARWVSWNPLLWLFELLRVLVAGGALGVMMMLKLMLFAAVLLLLGVFVFEKTIDSVVEEL